VIWRPSRRTFLEARVGRRYGSMSYTGSAAIRSARAAACRSACTTASRPSGSSSTARWRRCRPLRQHHRSVRQPVQRLHLRHHRRCGRRLPQPGLRIDGDLGLSLARRDRRGGAQPRQHADRRGRRLCGAPSSRRSVGGVSIDGTSDESIYGQLFASTDVGRNGSISTACSAAITIAICRGDGIVGWGANTAIHAHASDRSGRRVARACSVSTGKATPSDCQAQALLGLRYGF
jgi:hypothetical protein